MYWKLIAMLVGATGFVATMLLLAEGERELHERDYYRNQK